MNHLEGASFCSGEHKTSQTEFGIDSFVVYGTEYDMASVDEFSDTAQKLPQRPPDDVCRSMIDNSSYNCVIEMQPRGGHTKQCPTLDSSGGVLSDGLAIVG